MVADDPRTLATDDGGSQPVSTARNREWGAAAVSASHHAVQPVPDVDTTWCDGRVSKDIEVRVRTPEPRREALAEGTPVEVKAAAYRVVDDTTTRRGRLKIRRDNHATLREHGGVYVVGVYDPNSEPLPSAFLAIEFVALRVIEDAIAGAWADDAREEREAATVAWSAALDTQEVGI